MTYKRWSKEEEDLLRELWPDPRFSVDEIVKVFKDRRRSTVVKRASELRLKKGFSTGTIDYDLLKKMREVYEG